MRIINLPAAALLAVCALVACATASPAPKGWTPVPGAPGAWSSGAGATRQEYSYYTQPFSGGLQDLASQVTVTVLLHRRGARLRGSVPFAPCPGQAGVATFALPPAELLQEGFRVHDGQQIHTTYVRPRDAGVDSAVTAAMQSVLC